MGKKNFAPKIYPLDRDLSKRWFVRWYIIENGLKKRVQEWVEQEPILEKRLAIAQKIVQKWLKEGYKPPIKKAPRSASTQQIQLLFEYLEEIKPSIRRKTYLGYKSQLKNVDRYLQTEKLSSFNTETAKKFLNDLITKGGKTACTVNSYRRTLNSLFSNLAKERRIKENPFVHTKRMKGFSKGSTYFKVKQIDELKKHMLEHCPFLWQAVIWIYFCYIRPGELRLLKVGDIDFDNWQVKIPGAISKNRREQWVAIPDNLQKIIEPLCLYQYPSNFYLVGKEGIPSETPVGLNFWTYHHLKVLRHLNYSDAYNLYSWKHTGVCRAYKVGIGLKELQLQLRHHSLDMVKVYLESLGILDFQNIKAAFPAI